MAKRIASAAHLRLNLLISLYFVLFMTIEIESNNGVVYCMYKQIQERKTIKFKVYVSVISLSSYFIPQSQYCRDRIQDFIHPFFLLFGHEVGHKTQL